MKRDITIANLVRSSVKKETTGVFATGGIEHHNKVINQIIMRL
jgi:hypothetical protein